MADNKEAPKAKKEKKVDGDGGEVVHVHTSQRVKKKSNWTLDRCKKYARRFKTEMEWAEGAPASYKSAMAHGWVAQCIGGVKIGRKAG